MRAVTSTVPHVSPAHAATEREPAVEASKSSGLPPRQISHPPAPLSRFILTRWFIPLGVGGLLLPLLVVVTFSYQQINRDLETLVLSRRAALADLAAATLRERFDRITDLAISLATRVRFRQLVAQGEWDQAIIIMSNIPRDFPFVERLLLADPQGTLRADLPVIPSVRGTNFAFRDWYQGVSRTWEPYISAAYRRMAQPQYNVIAVAAPIKTEEQAVSGILVVQVRLDSLLEWANAINVGGGGFVFFIDQQRQIAAHPALPVQEDIVKFADVKGAPHLQATQPALFTWVDPLAREEVIAAYQPIVKYGWGVIVAQPTRTAFGPKKSALQQLAMIYAGLLALNGLFAWLVVRMVRRMTRAEHLLRQSNEELEAFSYSVSHDLRAPLRAIDGFSHILLEEHGAHLDEESQRLLSLVCVNAKQMGQLIDDLLAFSRLGRTQMLRTPVDMTTLVQDVWNTLAPTAPDRAVRFQVQPLPEATGDPAMLRQVLVNLLSNALKFTRSRAMADIEVSARQDAGRTIYTVQDNGVGFDMQHAGKLFGVFQRLHRSEEFEGTGVGLAIVQRVIHRHQGQVWAEGHVGEGATFFFTLG